MTDVKAYAKLADQLATVLREFADATGATAATEAEPTPAVVVGQPPRPADEHALGKRQSQLVEVPGLASEDGMKTADIAAAIAYEVPNTYTALQALTRSQVIEQVPGKEPQHWRLVRRYRATNQEYARVVGLLGSDEWATAADVSIAVRGDIHAADAIAAAGLSDRVLVDPSAADPDRRRVGWDELARRSRAQQTRSRLRHTRRQSMPNGVLNYVQIPTLDLEQSITFYERVFGWTVHRHPTVGGALDQSGYPEFADSTGNNGGGFVLGRSPSPDAGLLPHIAVDSIDDTIARVLENGGEVVKPKTPIVEGADWEALIRDPAGNSFGLFEEAVNASQSAS